MTRLAWGAHVSQAFRERVVAIAREIGADPSQLMAVMYFESVLNPAAVNSVSGASGLIQFMPSTARGLGTTVEDIRRMPALEQLELVRRYFLPYAGRVGDLASLYMAVLYPAAIGRADDDTLFAQGSAAYRDNAALDVNGDGRVTKAEATSFVFKRLVQGMRPENAAEVDADLTQPAAPIEDVGTPALPADVERIETEPQPEGQPMAPILIGLASTIFSAFAPALQALITSKLGKATGDTTAAGQVSAKLTEQLSAMITEAAKKITGETSELQAAAKVVADAEAQKAGDPSAGAIATAVAEDVASRVDAIMPAVREVAKLESELFAQEEASRDNAARRQAQIAADGGYDIRPLLARFGIIALSLMTLLVASLVVLSNWLQWNYTGELMTLFVGLVSFVMAKVGTLYDNAFGSSRGSAAKDALLSEMSFRAISNSGNGDSASLTSMPRGASRVSVTATK